MTDAMVDAMDTAQTGAGSAAGEGFRCSVSRLVRQFDEDCEFIRDAEAHGKVVMLKGIAVDMFGSFAAERPDLLREFEQARGAAVEGDTEKAALMFAIREKRALR